jgi:preprotein translocase subunit YajC
MHLHLYLLAQSTPATTVAKSTKSSSSYVPLLLIVLLFAVVYFLFLRPRQQRLRQQQTKTRELAVGDDVMSAGGILGRVVALDADEVEVEVSPGVVMTFTRRAISPRPESSGGSRSSPAPVDEPWDVPDGPGDSARAIDNGGAAKPARETGPSTGSSGPGGTEPPGSSGPAGEPGPPGGGSTGG